jgi:polar amino acid transport system ATP-binding protein
VTAPMLVVDRVSKHYGGDPVLDGVSLEVQRGEVLCLLGPSGSGKSTLLRCVNNLEDVQSGRITVDGRLVGYREHGPDALVKVSERRTAQDRLGVGMVFQNFNLFSHRTVLRNIVEAPLCVLREKRADAEARARELLAKVGLADKAGAYPAELSGGQQQRVAIARALAMKPSLILMDEPTSALDPELVGEVLGVVRDLAEEGMTMVIVTHEIGFAREVANRVAILADGKVIESGPAQQVIDHPTHQRAADFLARIRGAAAR